jgi:glycosyltransferase involved in cell wall biosynthesis
MQVTVLRTMPGEKRTSSEVYADELRSALLRLGEPGLEVLEVTSPSVLRSAAGHTPRLARLGGFADRYAVYQARASRIHGDVVHIVDQGYGHLAFTAGPRRTVVTVHDVLLSRLRAGEIPGLRHQQWLTTWGWEISLAAIRRATRVIADSHSAKSDAVRLAHIDPDRIRVIPLGVSPRFFRPAEQTQPEREHLRRGSPLRILHVGHCGPSKNVDAVLKALPRTAALLEHPVCLVKAGSAFTAAQRALIERLSIGGLVEHRGHVGADELCALYRTSDVVVLPSFDEGFGLVALEAMASGTPVVASRAGSLPELAGDAALLVDPIDVEAIATATARVLGNPGLASDMRERGLRRASTYTWERTACATLDVYKEVLACASI